MEKLNIYSPIHAVVSEAVKEQDTIEWDHAIRGHLSTKWAKAQALEDVRRGFEHGPN